MSVKNTGLELRVKKLMASYSCFVSFFLHFLVGYFLSWCLPSSSNVLSVSKSASWLLSFHCYVYKASSQMIESTGSKEEVLQAMTSYLNYMQLTFSYLHEDHLCELF